MSKAPVYFALEEPKAKVSVLLNKAQTWNNVVSSNNYLDKARASWMAYYGAQRGDSGNSHKVTFGGEQGELAQISINHYGNIADHLINLTTSNRPAMEAQAVNTDAKTDAQTILANGLLDYYMYQKRLEKYLTNAVTSAVVLGEGFIRLGWNEKEGDAVFYDETTGQTMYKGDIEFNNLSPFDVIRDISREDDKNDWILIRTYKNRFDVAAQYPQFTDAIMAVESKDYGEFSFNSMFQDPTDQIAVWEFYHRRTEAMPNGNYMSFVSEDAVLYNGALPYREIPVYRITMKEIMGTPLGYTSMWDLLSMQEAINALYSTILTNQVAFGVQNILMPQGSNITPENLAGGLNVLYYDPEQGKPESLNLTYTPAEIFKHIDMLKSDMETISGINSVIRGSPEASLRTGTALALVQAQAVSFASTLQASYQRLIEDVGTGIIKMLQDYADEPRIAFITGKSNRSYLQDFKGTDLSNVNRVIIRTTSALSKTTAGRLEIASQLNGMGFIKTPSQYEMVLATGKLENMYEGDVAQLKLIKQENEELAEGEVCPILETDWHMVHINEHAAVLNSPQIRKDPVIRDAVLAHIKGHVDMLQTADPALLQLLGQQGLPPPGVPGLEPAPGPTPGNAVQAQEGDQVAATMAPAAPEEARMPVPPELPPTTGDLAADTLVK